MKPGCYDIAVPDVGLYEPVSREIWEGLDGNRRLRFYAHAEPGRMAVAFYEDGVYIIDGFQGRARVMGERQKVAAFLEVAVRGGD